MTALLLALALSQKVFAQPINPLISFSVESCNLDEALEKLFAEYELNVAFSKAELSKIRIDGYTCSYKSVEEVLSDLLKGTGYGFKKVGKQFVIRKSLNIVVEPPANQKPEAAPPEEVVVLKTDTVVNKAADTVHIIDTMTRIRTVMRYDTIVQLETRTDTVYAVKYQGVAFPWPSFKDNGWFVSPALTISYLRLKYVEMDESVLLAPISAYGVGVDGGYKHDRVSVGMSLAYKSMKYSFSSDHNNVDGDYYVNDTLDTYYVVHPVGDTTYHYIIDSTYVPPTTTNFAWRDVNRIEYLSLGVFTSFDFVKKEYLRLFVKAGLTADFPLACSGSYAIAETPYHEEITKSQTGTVKLAWFGGLGLGFKAGNHFEVVPEVHYRQMIGSPYRPDFPLDMRLRFWDFRLGLTYYF